jgi:hypothetical protein
MTMSEELHTTTVIPVAAPTFALRVYTPPIGRRPVLEYVYAQRVPVVGWRIITIIEPDEIDITEPVLIGIRSRRPQPGSIEASLRITIFIELPEGLYDPWGGEYYPNVEAAKERVLTMA